MQCSKWMYQGTWQTLESLDRPGWGSCRGRRWAAPLAGSCKDSVLHPVLFLSDLRHPQEPQRVPLWASFGEMQTRGGRGCRSWRASGLPARLRSCAPSQGTDPGPPGAGEPRPRSGLQPRGLEGCQEAPGAVPSRAVRSPPLSTGWQCCVRLQSAARRGSQPPAEPPQPRPRVPAQPWGQRHGAPRARGAAGTSGLVPFQHHGALLAHICTLGWLLVLSLAVLPSLSARLSGVPPAHAGWKIPTAGMSLGRFKTCAKLPSHSWRAARYWCLIGHF